MKKYLLFQLFSLLFLSGVTIAQTASSIATTDTIGTPTEVMAADSIKTIDVNQNLRQIQLNNAQDSIITWQIMDDKIQLSPNEKINLQIKYDSLFQANYLVLTNENGDELYRFVKSTNHLLWWVGGLLAAILVTLLIVSGSRNKNEIPEYDQIVLQNNNSENSSSHFNILADSKFEEFNERTEKDWLYETVFVQRITDPDVLNFYNVLHFILNKIQHLDSNAATELQDNAAPLKDYPENPLLTQYLKCNCKDHNKQNLREYLNIDNEDPIRNLIRTLNKYNKKEGVTELYERMKEALQRLDLDVNLNKIT